MTKILPSLSIIVFMVVGWFSWWSVVKLAGRTVARQHASDGSTSASNYVTLN